MISIDELRKKALDIDTEKAAEEAVDWICDNVSTFIDNHVQKFVIGFSAIGTDASELEKIERLFEELDLGSGDANGIDSDLLDKVGCQLSSEDLKRATDLVEGYKSGKLISADAMKEVNDLLNQIDSANSFNERLELDKSEEIDEVQEEADRLTIIYDVVDKVKDSIVNSREKCHRIYEKMIYYYELCGIREGRRVERNLKGYVTVDEFQFYPYALPVTSTAKIPRLDDEGDFVLDDNDNVIVDIGESVVMREPPQFHVDVTIDFWEDTPQTAVF